MQDPYKSHPEQWLPEADRQDPHTVFCHSAVTLQRTNYKDLYTAYGL